MTTNTLTILVMKHAQTGRFRVTKQLDMEGNPEYAVFSLLAHAPVYGHLTQNQAGIIASLCNLTDDPDWSTLQPYMDELLPGLILMPDGVR